MNRYCPPVLFYWITEQIYPSVFLLLFGSLEAAASNPEFYVQLPLKATVSCMIGFGLTVIWSRTLAACKTTFHSCTRGWKKSVAFILCCRFVAEKRKAFSLQAVLVGRIAPPTLLFTEANLSNSEIAFFGRKEQFKIQERRGRERTKRWSLVCSFKLQHKYRLFFVSNMLGNSWINFTDKLVIFISNQAIYKKKRKEQQPCIGGVLSSVLLCFLSS